MPSVHFQTQTLDLFGSADEDPNLFSTYSEALNRWLDYARHNGQLTQATSVDTYVDLWTVLAKWCVSQTPPVLLTHLGIADLEAFIESRSGVKAPDKALSPRYVWRLLHLVDRVLGHHARMSNLPLNESAAQLLNSRPEWRYANAALTDTLPEYLTAGEAKQLVTYLSGARLRPGGRGSTHTWQELRNRTSVGLQLGAGLTPGDVRVLLVDSPIVAGGRLKDIPWKLIVPANGNAAMRESPVAPWAGQLLHHWLQTRADLGIQGNYLFPSTRSGKPWGKVAQYLAAKGVLEAAGFTDDVARGGSFRMRHTFALRQLRRGRTPEDVARWLGVVDPDVMARYRRVLTSPVDDLV